jgi:ABC-2 type transport system permease protein
VRFAIVKTIVQRDMLIVIRSKGVLLPMIILPVILMVLLPGLIGYFGPLLAEQFPSEMDDIDIFLDRMPANIAAELSPYNEIQTMVFVFINFMFAPFFLIMPVMVSSNIAASTFAGEKERKTLESLLYTPATDTELFLGKLLSAWIPAILVSLLSFILYGMTANLAAWRTMHQLFFPNLMWLILVVWVSPAAAGFGLVTMVVVSSKANTYQAASQIGGVVVLPIVLLILGQVSGVMYLSPLVVLLLGAGLFILDGLILRFAIRTFRRETVITVV